jgi:hypothetical protein
MINHPFIHSPEQYEEYLAARDAFAEVEDSMPEEDSGSLPEPPAEIFLDDSHLDGNWEDYEDEGGEDSYLDTYWEDQSEYGMDGCCGDF